MEDTTTYAWHSAYLAAVLETDQARMPERIYEAQKALQERLDNPVEIPTPELTAIKNARQGLDALTSERSPGRS